MSSYKISTPPPPTPALSPDYDAEQYHHYIPIETSLHYILLKIGGAISCISSFLLARHILKKKWVDISLPSMMLFGISVMDVIGSFFGYVMGLWMSGEGILYIQSGPLIAGNTQTCTAQGFILTFAFTYFLTAYAGLGALYYLMVKRGWTKNQLKSNKIRAAFLLPPVIAALLMSVPPLFYQMYNPSLFQCTLNQYPNNCENIPDVPCTRGENALIVQRATLMYALVCNLIVIVFMVLLIFSVYSQEKKSDKYLFKGQEKNRDNTTSTAWQGVRYAAALTIPYLPLYVFLGYMLDDHRAMGNTSLVFWLYLNVILTPLLGFNNACVYFYPRYKAYRKSNEDKSKFQCVCDTVGIGLPWKSYWTSGANSDSNLTEPLVDDSGDGGGSGHVI